MPIRFRCAYCNQLMGISTRKAGTVVRCPKCAGEIIVPVPEGMEPPEPPGQPSSPAQVFEDQAFEAILNDVPVPNEATATANVPAPPSAPPPELPVPAPPMPPPTPGRVGFFLPLSVFFVSIGVVVLLLILVFVLGLIIGRHTAQPDSSAANHDSFSVRMASCER